MNPNFSCSVLGTAVLLFAFHTEVRACDQSNPTSYPRSWNESCEGQIVPNEVFVTASVSASGNQMLHNSEEVKRQIGEVKKIATSFGAELVLKELNRSFAETTSNGFPIIPGSSGKAFVATQNFEIVMQKSVDVDTLVDKLNTLGTVNFGRSPGYNDGRMKPFVRYRATDGLAQLDKITERCQLRALEQACRGASEGERACLAALKKDAVIQNFSLQSQAIATEYGQYNPVALYYPGQVSQISNLELNGDIALNFSGSITVQTFPAAPAATAREVAATPQP